MYNNNPYLFGVLVNYLKWTLYRRILTRKIYEFVVKIHEFKYFKTFFLFFVIGNPRI
jgi:hypothetical protein